MYLSVSLQRMCIDCGYIDDTPANVPPPAPSGSKPAANKKVPAVGRDRPLFTRSVYQDGEEAEEVIQDTEQALLEVMNSLHSLYYVCF